MNAPNETLVDPAFLFRFQWSIQRDKLSWSTKGLSLPEACRVPDIGILAGRSAAADVRCAWSPDAIGWSVDVTQRAKSLWCREGRLEESDALQVWIDTRCAPGIHRATSYCHHFAFLPTGGGPRKESPIAMAIPIARAKSHPKAIDVAKLQVVSRVRHEGYHLSCKIPRTQLTGYDSANYNKLGVCWMVQDREQGPTLASVGMDYPFAEDPSLWLEAELV
ncbi:MAG: hypothetical protein AAF958_10965 [Planctomycetota bacterium]